MSKSTFPDQFNILITESNGLFIGTVEELPNVSAFEPTYWEAWSILADAICTLREIHLKEVGRE